MRTKILFFTALCSISVLAVLPDYSGLPEVISISDILNHSAAFCTLFILHRLSYTHTSTLTTVLLLFIYAVLIELVQSFLPTREASLSDILADLLGIFLGFGLLRLSGR